MSSHFCGLRSHFTLAVMFGSLRLLAAPLVTENFDYKDGSLVGADGSAWWTHSGTTGQVLVAGGRAVLSHASTEDISLNLPGGPYPAATNIELYAGLILQLKRLPSGAGDYLAHFKGAGASGYAAKLFTSTDGALPGCFRLGVAETSNTGTYATNQLGLDTDYLVVLRYRVSNANTTLWIEPASEDDLSVSAADSGTPGTVAGFSLRETTSMGACEIDLLRIGTNFAEVLPGNARLEPPKILDHPQSQIAAEGDSVQLRVRATGSAPVSYQWRLNGTNVPGATATTLDLESITRNQGGHYVAVVSNRAAVISSLPALITINPAPRPDETLTVVSYNLKGNGATDWSTNSAQVQAIGRQMAFLKPDLLAFNEVPYSQSWQMTNFIQTWLPGYHLAGNSGTDGYTRSVILSRWPVIFSRSWLDGISLEPFGSTNRFARDLFHAQVAVPFFPQPFNVFLTHLKATTDSPENDALRRGAEAAAISNFLTTVWLPTNRLQGYVLCGDLNEDIHRPDTNRYTSRFPIQTLASPPAGLRLTTPTNPYSGSDLTLSIQTKMTVRFDYVLPCTFFWSNIVDSQVFRSDLLPNPPSPLLAGDSATASDHLPVLVTFSNPYGKPFRLLSLEQTQAAVTLRWESVPGNVYRVEYSQDLKEWAVLSPSNMATGYWTELVTNQSSAASFFRVYREAK